MEEQPRAGALSGHSNKHRVCLDNPDIDIHSDSMLNRTRLIAMYFSRKVCFKKRQARANLGRPVRTQTGAQAGGRYYNLAQVFCY